MLKLRRSPRFRSDVQLLPIETLTSICEYLDLSSLANLRLVSKAWKGIIDSDSLMRKICVREGILPNLSQGLEDLKKPHGLETTSSEHRSDRHLYSALRRQGFTDEDLSSFWSLLRAKVIRDRGRPFRSKQGKSVPPHRKQYLCGVSWAQGGQGGVHRVVLDHIDRVLVTTHRGKGGLRVTCLDSGLLLFEDRSVPAYSALEISEGWILTSGDPFHLDRKTLLMWRFDRLSNRDRPKRGVLCKLDTITSTRAVIDHHFAFPHLVVLTKDDMHLCTFDVRDCKLLQDIDLTSTPPSMTQQSCFPLFVDFDDEYHFVLLETLEQHAEDLQPPWSLLVFSRQTGHHVWSLDTTRPAFTPQQRVYTFDSQSGYRESMTARWEQSSWDHACSTSPDPHSPDDELLRKVELCEDCRTQNGYWSLTDGSPVGLHHDSKSGSFCLLWGSSVAIFPAYKKMVQQGYERPYTVALLLLPTMDETDMPARSSACGDGLLCYNLSQATVLVDLCSLMAGKRRGSIVRFVPPEVDHIAAEYITKDCSGIHVDGKMLAFQNIEGRYNHNLRWHTDCDSCCGHTDCLEDRYAEPEEEDFEERSIVTLVDFASLTKVGASQDVKILPYIPQRQES